MRRLATVDVGTGFFELINPIIVAREGEQRGEEACLSCGDRRGIVVRPRSITVQSLNREGETVLYKAEGFLARAMCHEIDHLDGTLFIDVMERELFDGQEYEEEDGDERAR